MKTSLLEKTLSKIAKMRIVESKGQTQALSYKILREAGLSATRARQLRSASIEKIRETVLTGQAPAIVESKITKGVKRFTESKVLYAKSGSGTQYIYKISYTMRGTEDPDKRYYGTLISDRILTKKEAKEEFINNWMEQSAGGLLYTGTDENGEEIVFKINKSSIRVDKPEILTPEIREKLSKKFNAK